MLFLRRCALFTLLGLGFFICIKQGNAAGNSINTELKIVDYGPSGDLPIENRRPSIYAMFNQPMVPLAKLNQPMTESPLMTIFPSVPGVFRWLGTKTLGFIPDKAMLEHPRYIITLSGTAASLNGSSLGKDFSFEIIGERVRIVNYYAGNNANSHTGVRNVLPEIARRITLEFNQPVNPETIAAGIDININSSTVNFSVSRPAYPEWLKSRTERAILVRLGNVPPENTDIVISLKAGAIPFPDYPGTRNNQRVAIRTLAPFILEKMNINQYDYPNNNRAFSLPVYLRFSHELNSEQELQEFNVKLDGEAIKPDEISINWRIIKMKLPNVKPGNLVEIDLPPGIRDRYGREAKPASQSIEIPRPYPILVFPGEHRNFSHLEAQFKPVRLVWSSRNIESGSVGIGSRNSYYPFRDYSPVSKSVDFFKFPKDKFSYHEVNFEPWMNPDGYGTVFMNLNLNPERIKPAKKHGDFNRHIAVQVTNLGITTRVAHNKVLVWVNRLSDGSALRDAVVTLYNLTGAAFTALTDSDGLAVLPLEPGVMASTFSMKSSRSLQGDELLVRAEKDGDLAEFRVRNMHHVPWNYGRIEPTQTNRTLPRVHFFTDRSLYKSGEEMAVRGIHWNQNADGFASFVGQYSIRIVHYGKDSAIHTVTGRTSESGGFSSRFRLPDDIIPGIYELQYKAYKADATINFRVSNFRRSSFQVRAEAVKPQYLLGDSVEISINASRLSGGALSEAPYRFYWRRKPVTFIPPGPEWKNWSFGPGGWAADGSLDRGKGQLSTAGEAQLTTAALEQPLAGAAYRYTVEATVEDIDRQVISASASTLVHPASVYVAARFESGSTDGWWSRFVPTDKKINAQARLVDWDGKRSESREDLEFRLVKYEWVSADQQGLNGDINTRWEKVETEQWHEPVQMANGEAEFAFSVAEPGEYTLFVDYTDKSGLLARSSIEFYATGSGWVNRALETPRDIQLSPDKSLYEAGETARILVQSPIARGRYLLTVEREGIFDEKIIVLEGSLETIEVPVRKEYLPQFFVALSAFTSRDGQIESDYFKPDLGKPRSLFGITRVMVSTTEIELDVETVDLQETYRPGREAEFTVKVSKDGKPIPGAELVLLAVDRGVLDLIDYHIPNPLEYFYGTDKYPSAVMGDDSRNLLIRPVTYKVASLQGGDGRMNEKGESMLNAINEDERSNFNPLALFEPAVFTDSHGIARVKAVLPDNLSTYRLTAIALNGTRLGYNEDEFIVKNPVNVRTSLPRRFRVRDKVLAGLVLTNTLDREIVLSVKAESDIMKLGNESEKTVSLKPNADLELQFEIQTPQAGSGEIRFSISSDVLNETLVEPVTVEAPNVSEAVSSIGIISPEKSAEESIVLPANTGYGSLAINVNSSLKPWIQESIRQILDIPYPGPLVELYQIAAELADTGFSDKVKKHADTVFGQLASQQAPQGGLYYPISPSPLASRPDSYQADPNWFLTTLAIHLTDQLENTAAAFKNPLNMEAHLEYLKSQLDEEAKNYNNKIESPCSQFLSTWTAWLLSVHRSIEPDKLTWLYNARDNLGIGSYSLLASAYLNLNQRKKAETLYKDSKNYLTISTQNLNIKDSYEHKSWFSSNEIELALLLHTAVRFNETPELIMRIANALHGGRNASRLRSGFDNFWIITGFQDLLQNSDSPGAAKLYASLSGIPLIKSNSEPNEALTIRKIFPFSSPLLSSQPSNTALPLKLEQRGQGSLYYAATLTYVIPVETAMARDEGIEIVRSIETLDGKVLDPGKLPLGETLRVRVNISTLLSRSYLNLVVPIPSGAEILDSDMATTGQYADQGGPGIEVFESDIGYGDTVEFENHSGSAPELRYRWFYSTIRRVYDNAIAYTWPEFHAGNREISFLIRTISPGTFPTPPATASLEFEPEVFGRDGGMMAIIF